MAAPSVAACFDSSTDDSGSPAQRSEWQPRPAQYAQASTSISNAATPAPTTLAAQLNAVSGSPVWRSMHSLQHQFNEFGSPPSVQLRQWQPRLVKRAYVCFDISVDEIGSSPGVQRRQWQPSPVQCAQVLIAVVLTTVVVPSSPGVQRRHWQPSSVQHAQVLIAVVSAIAFAPSMGRGSSGQCSMHRPWLQ